MITVLGTACVAWTLYELLRLTRASGRSAAFAASFAESMERPAPRSRSEASSKRPRHFAAWDDRGRPISVEDLGHR